ncbi:MAG TPA: hypothetical protein VFY10_05155 [Dehalococcoidia bacterium]|nr:hypothetical protein [Dehalococcoidia bacterium]
MARYLIELPHTKEDCIQTLDSVVAFSNTLMDRIDWGCAAGVHTGWLLLEAEDAGGACRLVPTNIRDSARAVQLNKFTAKQVKSFHEAH